MGDFNCIIDSYERVGGTNLSHVGCKWFRNFLFTNALRDLGASRSKFTWSRGGLSQRLDRAICIIEWLSFAPDYLVRNLHRLKSDQRPVLVIIQPKISRGDRPFRCIAGWFCHKDFRNIIYSCWRHDIPVVENLDRFKDKVSDWNKKVYGNIFECKRRLTGELKRVQRILDYRFSHSLHKRDIDLRQELEEVLHHEELLWIQKSRSKWLKQGDRNTAYFHNRAIVRRKQNRIEGLMIENEWDFDDRVLQMHVRDFFVDLYKMDYLTNGSLNSSHSFPTIDVCDMNSLLAIATDDEIRKVVFSMVPLKAPGVDGFQASFFQTHWDIVGHSVCDFV